MAPDHHLSVIALHGIAQHDEEIEKIVPQVLEYAGSPGIRWFFPRARRRSVTVLQGSRARAWYDVATYDRSRLDKAGIERAIKAVCRRARAERERAGPDGSRVILMGFSQGGALALSAGLRLQGEIDGIVALAAAIPFPDSICPATVHSPTIFLGHGLFDSTVSFRQGRETRSLLAAKGYKTEWHTYAYRHTSGRRQLRDVSRWLHRNFLDDRTTCRLPARFARWLHARPAAPAVPPAL